MAVIDFDAFFAACEERDEPTLRGKPHAVGGRGGVVMTSSYGARKYGVRSAMASHIAIKLCPQLIFRPARFDVYQEASRRMRAVCESYGTCSMMSLDEAYVDLTDHMESAGADGKSVANVVSEMRSSISVATSGLTVSCGSGSTALVAKIGADINKPDGQHCLPDDPDRIREFMGPLSIRKLPGYVSR
jgi:nucleotidyltransferase/DNA polymerase involved in DNA repair